MSKILITGDVEGIANITVADKKHVVLVYHSGRRVEYLYNPHFDYDLYGESEYDKKHRLKSIEEPV